MNTKKAIILFTAIGATFFVSAFIVSGVAIGSHVEEKCAISQSKYQGDCVEALIDSVEDENAEFAEKNDSIWALGQLGDDRALPVLKRYYTGFEQHNEKTKRNEALSQYELYKAIKLLEGGFNATALVWR